MYLYRRKTFNLYEEEKNFIIWNGERRKGKSHKKSEDKH